MKNIRILNIPFLFRIILGITFIYASYHKILDPISFSDNIHNYHITPIEVENLAALFIAWLELIVGIFLILGIFFEGTISITIGLYIFFIIILYQAIYRGIDVHCGCFKSTSDLGVTDFRMELIKQIGQDIVLLGMAIVIKFKDKIPLLNK